MAATFDLAASLEKARRRLPAPSRAGRRPRADRGSLRVDRRIVELVGDAVGGRDRPQLAEVYRRLAERCRREGLEPPCRATFYKILAVLPARTTYRVAELPDAVRRALYNLEPESDVPAHQVAFYCFNYGDLAAMSFASTLPWLALYQALRLPGYRTRSRGLLEAAARARGIR